MTYFQKLTVTSYRVFAVILLSGVLAFAFGWFGVALLFQVNKSWTAPVLISKTHTRIMSLTADVFRTKQASDDLGVKTAALRAENDALRQQEGALVEMVARYEKAVRSQQDADRKMAERLVALGGRKRGDDEAAARLAQSNAQLRQSIDKNLAAGLITAEAAVHARAQLVASQMSATNARLSTAALDRQAQELSSAAATIDGQASDSTAALDALARVAQFKRELAETRLVLSRNAMELENKLREKAQLDAMLKTIEQNPYYRASVSAEPLPFAFVPYKNEKAAAVGASVYSCALRVVLCSKVGTITRVHTDEEKLRHPTNNEDVRGFLVELNLQDALAAKDKVLFIGSGPLFI